MNYVIRIDGEPVGKGRPRFTRYGKPYTPEKTKQYGKRIIEQWRQQYGDAVLTGAVRIGITAYYKISKSDSMKLRMAKLLGTEHCLKKPDIDNVVKEIMDYVPWEVGDQQCVSLSVEKRWSETPYLVASFWEL